MRVMARLNLTLDDDTFRALNRHARRARKPTASVARRFLTEAIAAEDARERLQKLARDYSGGRKDAEKLIEELESPQLDLLDGE